MLARMVLRLEGQSSGEGGGLSPVLSPAAKLDPAVRPVSGLTSRLILQADRHRLPAFASRKALERSGFGMPSSLDYRCGGSAGIVALATHRLPVHLTVGRQRRQPAMRCQESMVSRMEILPRASNWPRFVASNK